MGSDILEVLAFFSNVEQLFTALEIPDSAKSIIIRPYLNDKSRMIVTRLSAELAFEIRIR
jgi:hypothetical protein